MRRTFRAETRARRVDLLWIEMDVGRSLEHCSSQCGVANDAMHGAKVEMFFSQIVLLLGDLSLR